MPTLTTLASIDSVEGGSPYAGLIVNAAGDLFGTTSSGTVFELVKTVAGYAATPTILLGPYGSVQIS